MTPTHATLRRLGVASRSGGIGMVIIVNVAPEDMSGAVPQLGFLMSLVRRVAEVERWCRRCHIGQE
jgi:hypothetical protein